MNDERRSKNIDTTKTIRSKAKQQRRQVLPRHRSTRIMIVAFGVFVLLLLLAVFMGVQAEPKADPSDTTYVPRPEWYFLFLFEMLKFFPGSIEWVGTAIVPGLAVLALLLLPFIDRNPSRHWRRRKLALGDHERHRGRHRRR